MANICSVSITVPTTDPNVASILELLAENSTPSRNATDPVVIVHFDKIVGCTLEPDFGWRWTDSITDPPPVDDAGEYLLFSGETRWAPPGDFMSALSKTFTNSRLTMRFQVEDEPRMAITYDHGSEICTYWSYGYYRSAESHEPVHHWRVEFCGSPDEPPAALLRHVYGGEEVVGFGDVVRKSPDEVIQIVNSQCPDVNLTAGWVHPITLDERIFWGVHWGECRIDVPASITVDLPSCIELLQRDITLTSSEIVAVRDHYRSTELRDHGDFFRLRILSRLTDALPLSDEVDLLEERMREQQHSFCYQEWDPTFREDLYTQFERLDALAAEYGSAFHPLAWECEVLISAASESRREELREAIRKPRWTETWPLWEEPEQKLNSDSD